MNKSIKTSWIIYVVMCGLVAITMSQRRRPNIILLVADDQDILLNSMDVMSKTKEFLIQKGVEFKNAFTTTPICCPSRSSILTGLYTHNHQVYTNNDNCSSSIWRRFYESRSYATYLDRSGYHTGYFGKYLNDYNGSHIPPGWDYWMGLVKNSKYYNYTLRHNGIRELHGNNYAKDYLTDLVTNRSIEFFRNSKLEDPERPVLAVASFPAPHGPEDGAPQYQDLFSDTETHITQSFDYFPNPDKHWIIRQRNTGMDETQLRFSKLLQQKRLQTLLSVDDGVKKIIDMLRDINELENTYIIYSSDHGYHIGQFGIPKGKSMPYDFDIRIPFFVRGPGLPNNYKSNKIALNIDIAPTILGIAGVSVPVDMDGRNLLDLFDEEKLEAKPWRDSFLVERGKLPRNRTHLVRPKMPKETKIEKLKKLCQTPNYVNPCQISQFWTCVTDSEGKLRLQKCKKDKKPPKPRRRININYRRRKCPCPADHNPLDGIDRDSDEVNVLQTCSRRGLGSSGAYRNQRGNRNRLSKRNSYRNMMNAQKRTWNSYNNLRKAKTLNKRRFKRDIPTQNIDDNQKDRSGSKASKRDSMVLTSSCRLYMPNFEIRCLENLYTNPHEWVKHMGHLARSVKTLQIRMKYMKTLRSCLNSYDEMIKSRVRMCDCPPPPPPKQKNPKVKLETQGNITHPLTDLAQIEDKEFTERQRKFMEHRDTVRLIKEMRQEKQRRIAAREKSGRFRYKKCGTNGVICFKLTKSTWHTEPKWDGDDRCYCTNSNNNTYWCVRIINENTNLLYCQFITGFIEFFEMNRDPAQLVNRETDLSKEQHDVFLGMVGTLRKCKGASNCTLDPFTDTVLPTTEPVFDMQPIPEDPQGRSLSQLDLPYEDPVQQLPFVVNNVTVSQEESEFDQTNIENPVEEPTRRGKGKIRRGKAKWKARIGRIRRRPELSWPKDKKRKKFQHRNQVLRKQRWSKKLSKSGNKAHNKRGKGMVAAGQTAELDTHMLKKIRAQRKERTRQSNNWFY
ncbi:extracellular sulfatase Sulf-2-like isoform X2 [Styela clava]|uniref:putative extracellular sulfatase Sulf-1 homolog isoform X2 n=1 Tax=Styela clava TaxID=7725 RepID=UPI0019396803|nr:putative extracellular sulfatase Sulf-1 homolog isoform X2 [Styela clava]